jgi:hypothetical protein
MRCLTDVELQGVVDGETTEDHRAHAIACARCGPRLEARRADMARLTGLSGGGSVPASLEERVRRAVAAAPVLAAIQGTAQGTVQGATVLRPSASRSFRPLWASALGALAVAAIVIVAVLPRVDAPATLSASQIIDKSLARMTTGRGVEILEYELVLASTSRQAQGLSQGPFHVVQLFDRDNPGHYKFAEYDAAGVMQSAASQDPARRRRSELIRVDGRNFIVHVQMPEPLPSLPEMVQAQAESVLRMMQLGADQHLTVVDGPGGRQYVIEMPPMPPVSAAVPLTLDHARVVIDGADFRVREFNARGVLLKQPFDLSFTLISQIKAASIAPGDWEITAGDDDMVIEGEGSGRLDDVTSVVLRELAKARGR